MTVFSRFSDPIIYRALSFFSRGNTQRTKELKQLYKDIVIQKGVETMWNVKMKLLLGTAIVIFVIIVSFKSPEGVVEKENFMVQDVTDTQLSEKFGEKYEIIDIYNGEYKGKNTVIYRIAVENQTYLTHFKLKGATIFSGKEIFKVEKITEITGDNKLM